MKLNDMLNDSQLSELQDTSPDQKYGGEIEYIPFPDHLKGKYQAYTCASMDWLKLNDLPYHFITVEDYLK